MSVNVNMQVEGEELVIRIDLSQRNGQSSSGKSTIIASTQGNISVPGTDAKLGLNVYQKD